MYIEPCAKLTIRVTPKISDRPTAIRKRVDAPASPFKSWTPREAIMQGRSGPVRGAAEATYCAGRSLATTASGGITALPSM